MTELAALPMSVPFTTRQAMELGVPKFVLAEGVRRRELRKLLRGVYVRSSVQDSTSLRVHAASLVVSKHSVVCDRTAAWVWGVDTWQYAELDVLPPLETYVLRGHRATNRPECAGGTRDLQRCDWVWVDGVRVTTPIRTAMDLGCKLPRRRALAAMVALVRSCGFSQADMVSLLPRYRRRRGVVQLRHLVALVDDRLESSGECWTWLEIGDHNLPMPQPQYWVRIAGVPTYRLDFAWPHARVCVEYDGEEFHSSEEDRLADEQRRAWLREQRWTVIVLTKESFTDEAIRGWTRELRTALGLR